MEKFPKLEGEQVALLRADVNTGHVLDDTLNLAVNDHQKVFTLFDDVEEALLFAKELISQNNKVECVIYSEGRKVLHHTIPKVMRFDKKL